MKRAATLIALLLCMSGCTTTRYVKISCVTPEQYEKLKAAEPERVGGKLTGQAQEDYKIVAGSAIRLRAWGQGNLKILGGCVG